MPYAFCVELEDVVSIGQARRAFLSRERPPDKFNFLCADEFCRKHRVRVTGVNYRTAAQESAKFRIPYFSPAQEIDTFPRACFFVLTLESWQSLSTTAVPGQSRWPPQWPVLPAVHQAAVPPFRQTSNTRSRSPSGHQSRARSVAPTSPDAPAPIFPVSFRCSRNCSYRRRWSLRSCQRPNTSFMSGRFSGGHSWPLLGGH